MNMPSDKPTDYAFNIGNNIEVKKVWYRFMWHFCEDHVRISLYKDGTRINFRKLPIQIDRGRGTVKLLVERMVDDVAKRKKC